MDEAQQFGFNASVVQLKSEEPQQSKRKSSLHGPLLTVMQSVILGMCVCACVCVCVCVCVPSLWVDCLYALEELDATYDSDNEAVTQKWTWYVCLDKLCVVHKVGCIVSIGWYSINKKGPVKRWDFDTEDAYSEYQSRREAMPK